MGGVSPPMTTTADLSFLAQQKISKTLYGVIDFVVACPLKVMFVVHQIHRIKCPIFSILIKII